MGYELEINIKFEGQSKHDGMECSVELKEMCDDLSDPEYRISVTKDKGKESAKALKQEMLAGGVVETVAAKVREVLNKIRDEA